MPLLLQQQLPPMVMTVTPLAQLMHLMQRWCPWLTRALRSYVPWHDVVAEAPGLRVGALGGWGQRGPLLHRTHEHACVCVCAGVLVRVCACVRVNVVACLHVFVCVCACVCMHACTHECMCCTYVRACTCLHQSVTCMHAPASVCVVRMCVRARVCTNLSHACTRASGHPNCMHRAANWQSRLQREDLSV